MSKLIHGNSDGYREEVRDYRHPKIIGKTLLHKMNLMEEQVSEPWTEEEKKAYEDQKAEMMLKSTSMAVPFELTSAKLAMFPDLVSYVNDESAPGGRKIVSVCRVEDLLIQHFQKQQQEDEAAILKELDDSDCDKQVEQNSKRRFKKDE